MKTGYKQKIGFTLAEVLITLGIIGVVAAITIPGLITKYRRIVVESKLKKFYSTMNQALKMSLTDHEYIPELDYEDTSAASGSENNTQHSTELLDWYKEYIFKYLSGIHYDKINNVYIKATFNDGTGFVSYTGGKTKHVLWIFYCLNASDSSCKQESFDGKNTFLFEYNFEEQLFDAGSNASDLADRSDKISCYYKSDAHKRHTCTRLIKNNGWKIPDDYPWL